MSSTTRAWCWTAHIATATALALGHAACEDGPAGVAADTAIATGSDSATTTPGTADAADTGPGAETTPDGVAVAFVVTVPAETPLGATLTVTCAGGSPIQLVQDADGAYRGNASIAAGTSLSWQVAMSAPIAATEAAAPRTLSVTAAPQSVTATVDHWALPATGADVALVVTVPAETPNDSHIWIAGNDAALGAWDPAGLELMRVQGGRWGALFQVPPGTSLEMKTTRGSWDTVEKAADGSEIQNRVAVIASDFQRIAYAVAAWRDLAATSPGELSASRIEFMRGVGSTHLASTRDIIVFLPPGYDDDTSKRYPVLYMHDGQNLMDDATSFGGEWRVDEAADQGIRAGEIEPLLVVGVYNTGARMSEYTQAYDAEYSTGGDADDYGAFLATELKPQIDATYRTRPDAASTGVAGSSLGGLVSMYFGLTRSDTFGRIGAVSPSVWWANKDILARVNALGGKLPIRVWVDIGKGEPASAITNAKAQSDALAAKGWVLGQDLAHGEYDGGHDEGAWSARIGTILRWLFPAP